MFQAELQECCACGFEDLHSMCGENGAVHAPLQTPPEAWYKMLATAGQKRLEEHSTLRFKHGARFLELELFLFGH
jgi:hypothetical protein